MTTPNRVKHNPRYTRQHFVLNKDGSVYSVLFGYVIKDHAQRHIAKFDGDMEKALAWTNTVLITNPAEVVAGGPTLYEEDRENFLKEATQLVAPYDDPNKVYDRANDHVFKIECTKPSADSEMGENPNPSLEIKGDRLEMVLALWEATTNKNGEYLLDKVTETHQGQVLRVWEDPDTTAFERSELILVFSAQP